ncbi:hypothetical protein [Campylobacter hyointestinalis]|uniref:Lipoprotein n=1 Tax=Campylobacter hyointestinalis subsp. lawsonii TaxID=91353 RepID=A0AAV6EF08_CAMHY|nr:hypothetical protein [Campylobacter hyointestinalis]KAB0612460.1 hypothetical protein F7P66_06470 [Campylobacter hyointestinalis subsp. lawsonii]QKF68912.1 hypothetical protein CHLWT_0300 [Campylobacter hyointestinalis subsp. lawsonii]RAZ29515.1 hypothetical protein CHLT_01465 [Campylobacter hyointestinalis subsp. lawsonii]RAZ50258.1 hypothetical protein CHL9004_03100 [Campylobacter hyointestinalis subsp. lawsonii]
MKISCKFSLNLERVSYYCELDFLKEDKMKKFLSVVCLVALFVGCGNEANADRLLKNLAKLDC